MNFIPKVFILFLLILASCGSKEESIKIIDLNGILNNLHSVSRNREQPIEVIDLTRLIPFKDWDELMVIPPYTQEKFVKGLKYGNIQQIESIIINNTFNDGICTLLFLKKDKIVAYSMVHNVPIEFLELSSYKTNRLEAASKEKLKNVLLNRRSGREQFLSFN